MFLRWKDFRRASPGNTVYSRRFRDQFQAWYGFGRIPTNGFRIRSKTVIGSGSIPRPLCGPNLLRIHDQYQEYMDYGTSTKTSMDLGLILRPV